jgi:hypothetical protein
MEEAYTLISKVGISYSDVKTLTRTERVSFLKLYIKEKEAEAKLTENK